MPSLKRIQQDKAAAKTEKPKRQRRKAGEQPPFIRHASGQGCAWIDGEYRYFGRFEDPDAKRLYNATIRLWQDCDRTLPEDWFSQAADTIADAYTVDELALDYIESLRRDHGDEDRGGLIKENKRLYKIYAPLIGTKPCGSLTIADIQAIRHKLESLPGISGKRRTVGTVKRQLGTIRSMLAFGLASHGVTLEIYELTLRVIKSVRLNKRLRPTGSDKQDYAAPALVADILAAPKTTNTVRGLIRAALLAGMRPMEAARVKEEDFTPAETYYRSTGQIIDEDGVELLFGGSLDLRQDLSRFKGYWVYTPEVYKGDRFEDVRREIIIRPAAYEMLREYFDECQPHEFAFSPKRNQAEVIQRQREERQRARADGRAPSKPAGFGRPTTAECYNKNTLCQVIERACMYCNPYPEGVAREDGESDKEWRQRINADAGLKQEYLEHRKTRFITMRQLRKLYAQLVRHIEGLEAAAKQLGHTESDTTANHYTVPALEELLAGAAALENLEEPR